MQDRCYNPNSSLYKWYGARNISIDDQWRGKGNFLNFYNWSLSNGYKQGLHIHRKNNDQGYSPDNCVWVSARENNRAKGNNVLVIAHGESMLLPEWVEEGHSNVIGTTLHKRIGAGWTPEEAMSKGPRAKRDRPVLPTQQKSLSKLNWSDILNSPKPKHKDAIETPLNLHYGYLTVLGDPVIWPVGSTGKTAIKVPVMCRCGNEKMVFRSKLIDETTKSCGCYKTERLVAFNTKHGGSRSVLYSRWQTMKNRCNNCNVVNYADYGGRGIRVCYEWLNDYASFRNWAETHGFEEEEEIDRIDGDGNYSPENCRWVTPKLNQRNRRDNRPVVAWGEEKLLVEWSEDPRCCVGYGTLLHRLESDWRPEDALSCFPGEFPKVDIGMNLDTAE